MGEDARFRGDFFFQGVMSPLTFSTIYSIFLFFSVTNYN